MNNDRPFIAIDPADQELLVGELGAARAGSAFLVWYRLNREALRTRGESVTVSLSRLGYDTGLTRCHIPRYIAELERLGFIAVTRQTSETATGNRRHEPSQFTLIRGCYPGGKMSPPSIEMIPPSIKKSEQLPQQNDTTITRDTRKNNKSASAPVVFPASLDVPEFRAAWESWERYKKEKRQKLTPSTREGQLLELAALPVAIAIAAIKKSINKGWMGLFPENAPAADPTPTTTERFPT